MQAVPTQIRQLRSNCTLVAVKEITDRPDEEIIAEFLRLGYRLHHGVHSYVYMKVLKNFGIEFEEVDTKHKDRSFWGKPRRHWWGDEYEPVNAARHMTIGQFVEAFPTGTYLVSTGGHAFVIRDGQVVDPNFNSKNRFVQPRRRLKDAYRIENPAPSRFLSTKPATTVDGDPMVAFNPLEWSRRSPTSKAREKERAAEHFANEHGVEREAVLIRNDVTILRFVPLSSLKKFGYGKDWAEWDLKRGDRLILISDPRVR